MSDENETGALGNALGVQGLSQLSSSVSVIRTRLTKGERAVRKAEERVLASQAMSTDDLDTNAFDVEGKAKSITPTYPLSLLAYLCHQNNTLLQCIAAMEVNIDGTGYEIERADGAPVTDADKGAIADIKAFFDETYPGESFVTLRRQLRRDIESSGCGYIEVIRDGGGNLGFLRRMDSKLTRLVQLDDPVLAEKKVKRGGKELTAKMLVRERRFVQQIGTKLRFFKEFGASRAVNSSNGQWITANPAQPATAAAQPGNEVIFITAIPDVATAYGVPRWIGQVPSILGSRKAEEFNLEFFNSGGLPPAMIFVSGGVLTTESRNALTGYLAGKAKFKQRAVIAEIQPAGGSIDGSSSVRVTVERFGTERQQDSMFGQYDERCGEHVRQAFRLPPLFIGKSQDQNFATAYASYLVAEAQVFKPEREEFDEIVNVKLMRELNPEYVFRSLPMSINDVEKQLQALELAKDMADPEKFISQLNEIASLTLTLREDYEDDQALAAVNELLGRETLGNKLDRRDSANEDDPVGERKDNVVRIGAGKKGKIKKLDDTVLTDLAQDWSDYTTGRREFTKSSTDAMHALIKAMEPPLRTLFNGYVADRALAPKHDPAGTAALLGCAADALADGDDA